MPNFEEIYQESVIEELREIASWLEAIADELNTLNKNLAKDREEQQA